MSNVLRRWTGRTLAFLLLVVSSGCMVSSRGYVGGVYEPTGYVYGGWGPDYRVGPPRHGGQRRPEQSPPRAYRPAPRSRTLPSIPTHPHTH
jgi:hypothetical protein